MLIKYTEPMTREKVGELTPKQIHRIYQLPSTERVEKSHLFNGLFNEVEVRLMSKKEVCFKFSRSGKIGYKKKYFGLPFIQMITQSWINSPILNRSGLATLIWNDDIPNKLRRRLENRAKAMTFRDEEKQIIIEELEKFVDEVKRSLDNS